MNSVSLALALAVILPRAAPRMTTIDGGMGTKVVGRTRCPQGTPSEQLILFLHIHKAGGSSVTSSAFDSGLCGPKFSINGNPWSETPAATGRKPYYLYRPEVMAPAERRKYLSETLGQGTEFIAMEWGWFRTPTEELWLPPNVRLLVSIREPWERMLSNMFHSADIPPQNGCWTGKDIGDNLADSLKRYQACDFTWGNGSRKRHRARLPDGTPQDFNVSYNKDNFLTRMLSGYGSHPRIPLDQNDLERAKAQLRAFGTIVVLEMPETHAAMLCIGIKHMEHKNSASDHATVDHKTKAMYSATTLARVAADFATRNQLDSQLYDYGVSLARARLDDPPPHGGCRDRSEVVSGT